jgi:hypothetical protein
MSVSLSAQRWLVCITERKINKPPEVESIEAVHVNVVHGAELLMPGSAIGRPREFATGGQTAEELAYEVAHHVSSHVFGIKTFKKVEGVVIVDGKPIRVSSDNFNCSSTTYIGGHIITLEDIRNKRIRHSGEMLLMMERNGCDKIIKTRVGTYAPFREGDRIISLPKRG